MYPNPNNPRDMEKVTFEINHEGKNHEDYPDLPVGSLDSATYAKWSMGKSRVEKAGPEYQMFDGGIFDNIKWIMSIATFIGAIWLVNAKGGNLMEGMALFTVLLFTFLMPMSFYMDIVDSIYGNKLNEQEKKYRLKLGDRLQILLASGVAMGIVAFILFGVLSDTNTWIANLIGADKSMVDAVILPILGSLVAIPVGYARYVGVKKAGFAKQVVVNN